MAVTVTVLIKCSANDRLHVHAQQHGRRDTNRLAIHERLHLDTIERVEVELLRFHAASSESSSSSVSSSSSSGCAKIGALHASHSVSASRLLLSLIHISEPTRLLS